MPAKESFDIDGLMVFEGNYTAKDQDGNVVPSVITPDRYKQKDREPLSSEQTGRYTNTTAYWKDHSDIVPAKGDVYIYSDGATEEQGGVTINIPKIKVGDGVTTIDNLPFADSDNQGGGEAGTLDTTNTSAQTPDASESLSGVVNLHKVAKTGSYDDLLNKPIEIIKITETTANNVVTYSCDKDSLDFYNIISSGAEMFFVFIDGQGSIYHLDTCTFFALAESNYLYFETRLYVYKDEYDYRLIIDISYNNAPAEGTQVTVSAYSEGGIRSDWNETNPNSLSYIKNKPTIPSAQVQSNWTETSSSSPSYIQNKPTLGTAAAKNVPSSGNASTTEVVMGNDSRLTDARTPTAHTHGNITNDGKVGSASGKILTTGTGGAVQASDSITKSMISDFPTLATVATSGSYNDLSNKPTIPAAQIQSDWNQSDNTADDFIKNKPQNIVTDASYVHTDNNYTTTEKNKLAGIAAGAEVNVQSDWGQTDNTADDYIKNKPTIPSAANNGVLTLQQNGTTLGTFSADQSLNQTINVTTKEDFVCTFNYQIDDNSEEEFPKNAIWSCDKTIAQIHTAVVNGDNVLGKIIVSENDDYIMNVLRFAGEALSNNNYGYLFHCVCHFGLNIINFIIFGSRNNNADNWNANMSFDMNDVSNLNNLATVATSGSYNDLTNKPTIPTVPTNVSSFTNDAGYITNSDLPTIDTELSETSTNPVQNKAIGTELRKLWENVDVVSRLDDSYEQHNGYISSSTGSWNSSTTYKHWVVPVDKMRKVVITANSNTDAYYTFFATYTESSSVPTTTYATGYSNVVKVDAGTSASVVVPCDANYMYLNTGSSGAAKAESIVLTGIGVTEHCGTSSQVVKADGTVANVVTVYSGSSAPSSSLGSNGDIYIQTTA